jgi:hypothetical protein
MTRNVLALQAVWDEEAHYSDLPNYPDTKLIFPLSQIPKLLVSVLTPVYHFPSLLFMPTNLFAGKFEYIPLTFLGKAIIYSIITLIN